VVGAVVVGDGAGGPGLVEAVCLETDGERLHRLVKQVGENPDDDAGVDAAAQKGSQRHVTLEASLDCSCQCLPERVGRAIESRRAGCD